MNNEVNALADNANSIQRVGIKYSPFWRANPKTWFGQLESQFALAGVTNNVTKYHHLVASLQPEELGIVGDIIASPPQDDPYAVLKARLINQYAVSEDTRLRELVSGMQLGDKKPSRLLLEMRSKAGAQVGDELLKTLFVQRLPPNVQQILAISDDKLDKLAEMADGIMAATGPVSSVQSVNNNEDLRTLILNISSRLEKLETRSFDVETRGRSSSRPRHSRNRSQSRDRRYESQKGSSLCWYHYNFQERAKKCKEPCSWAENH